VEPLLSFRLLPPLLDAAAFVVDVDVDVDVVVDVAVAVAVAVAGVVAVREKTRRENRKPCHRFDIETTHQN